MIDDFNVATLTPEAPAEDTALDTNRFTAYIPSMGMEYPKPRGKKRKKGTKGKRTQEALEKAMRERDQLLYANGRLSMENDILKRVFTLVTAVKREQFDDNLAENAVRLLPPKRKG